MGRDDDDDDTEQGLPVREALSVSETGAYSAASQGPAQDADVHTARPEVHGDAPAHLERPERNRATPDPMAGLRRNVKERAGHGGEEAPTIVGNTSRLPMFVLGGVVVLIVMCTGAAGVLGMSLLSGADDHAMEPPDPQVPPAPAPANRPVVPPPPAPPVAPAPRPAPLDQRPAQAPAGEAKPKPVEEFDGVPVRKGLRGE